MVTGASTADLAIILVDAAKGVLTQSRRHAFITSLLGIPHIVVAVNKMDLVDYDQAVYDAIVKEFNEFAAKLTVQAISFVPLSALEGDNVVTSSTRMPWYQGGPLLHRLETVNVGARTNAIDFRFPVQYVIRPNQSFRGYAGTIASGSVTSRRTRSSCCRPASRRASRASRPSTASCRRRRWAMPSSSRPPTNSTSRAAT